MRIATPFGAALLGMLLGGCAMIFGFEPGTDPPGPNVPLSAPYEAAADALGDALVPPEAGSAVRVDVSSLSAAEYCQATVKNVPDALLSPDFEAFTSNGWWRDAWDNDANLSAAAIIPTYHAGPPSHAGILTGGPGSDITAYFRFTGRPTFDSFELTFCMRVNRFFAPINTSFFEVDWAGTEDGRKNYHLAARGDAWVHGRWSADAPEILNNIAAPGPMNVTRWVGVRIRHRIGQAPRLWVDDFTDAGFYNPADAKPFGAGVIRFAARNADVSLANVLVLPLP